MPGLDIVSSVPCSPQLFCSTRLVKHKPEIAIPRGSMMGSDFLGRRKCLTKRYPSATMRLLEESIQNISADQ